MDGYLLDTNFVSILLNSRNPKHETVKTFFAGISQSPVWLSIIALAEIERGLKTTLKIDIDKQKEVRRKISLYPLLDIDKHTAASYSDLWAELFKNYSPRDRRGRLTVKWPEDLIDRTTAKELGVQENDIWIAAQATQYNLILVTDDHMVRLKEVSKSLNYPLAIANWR